MWRAQSRAKPSFLWQAVLITLPVGLLAALGFVSLRQDRMLARQDATERARALAEALAPRLWTELSLFNETNVPAGRSFQVNSAGELVFPPPSPPLPPNQPLNTDDLNEAQAGLWVGAQRAENSDDLASAVTAWQAFLQTNPSQNFCAVAQYSLGLLFERQGSHQEAADRFNLVLTRFPQALGESGLPLAPLALWQLYELGATRGSVAAPKNIVPVSTLCSNAVTFPTALSTLILEKVSENSDSKVVEEVAKWRQRWLDQAIARDLYEAARPQLDRRKATPVRLASAALEPPGSAWRQAFSTEALPRLFWFRLSDRLESTDGVAIPARAGADEMPWLAFRLGDSPSNHWFVCSSESEIGSRLTPLVAQAERIPDYFGVGIELAGRTLTRNAPDRRQWREVSYLTKGAGGLRREDSNELATELLASAAKSENGVEVLKVNVYLTSPDGLFKRQNARTFWFGALIAAAAAAALVGLVAAYRAFHRQLRLSEMKSNFVSSVSHELRAPIASVRLMAESLESGRIHESPKQQEYFRFIVQECRRLSSLIENVLDFSRIEQGRKEYEFEPTDLVALVTQTVRLMEPPAAEKQINLALAIDPVLQDHPLNQGRETGAAALKNETSLEVSALTHAGRSSLAAQVEVDGKAIQQALINLIDNALKHSPKAGTVTVGLEAADAGRPEARPPGRAEAEERESVGALSVPHSSSTYLRLWVEDQGEGIPAEEHEKIFERFYRRGSELRRETQGVGIGLSIVRHVVEAHGGRVLVRSSVGQGSRFTIELPTETESRNPKTA